MLSFGFNLASYPNSKLSHNVIWLLIHNNEESDNEVAYKQGYQNQSVLWTRGSSVNLTRKPDF